MQHLIPLAVLVPYCAYVIGTSFADHHEQRAENDRRRKDSRAVGAVEHVEAKK